MSGLGTIKIGRDMPTGSRDPYHLLDMIEELSIHKIDEIMYSHCTLDFLSHKRICFLSPFPFAVLSFVICYSLLLFSVF